jgi:hypothetical protein
MRARHLPIAALLIGAALLVAGVFGHRWGTLRGGGEVGLLDTIGCGDGCANGLHGTTAPTRIEGEQFARLGQLALILGALAALAALAAAHPRLRRPLAVPAAALAIGTVAAATAFAVTPPFAQFGQWWRPGVAWWLVAAGAALVTAGVRLGAPERPRARVSWVLVAIAAPLLALTARTTAWWRGAMNEYDVGATELAAGPAMVEICGRTGCTQMRLGDATTLADGFDAPHASLMGEVVDGVLPTHRLRASSIVAGRAIAVTAAIAAVLAAALALAIAARRRARALAWATAGVVALLFVAIAVFEAGDPGGAVARVGVMHRAPGLPVALGAAGLALGVAIAQVRAGAERVAPAPPTTATATPSGAAAITTAAAVEGIPPSPACGAPMLFVSKRKAWICTVCKARDSVAT